MKRTIRFYRELSSPWICAVVYLWLLELRAAIGTDSEPVLAWLADSAAILLTIVFWTCVVCIPLTIIGGLVGKARILGFNGFTVKAGLIAVTAMHFVRWSMNWPSLIPGYDLVQIFLIAAAAGIVIYLFVRQRKHRSNVGMVLPSSEDCFSAGALPVLLGAIGLIVFRILGDFLPAHQYVMAEAPRSATDSALKSRPNIILIVADALRAPSMSLHGYARRTTPHIDRWAETATVYLEAHTNSVSTKPSMTSILTGKHPLTHGRLIKALPPDRSDENLLRLLRDHGYWVEAVTSIEDASMRLLGFDSSLSKNEHTAFQYLTLSWLRDLGVYPTSTGGRIYQNVSLFIRFLGYPFRTSYHGNAEDTLKISKDVIGRARQPFFLIIHLHEPHDPYDAPPPFRGVYASPLPAHMDKSISSSHYAFYEAKLQPIVDFYRDQYEESIRYLDDQLGNFFRDTEALLAGQEYLVIFTGDHGESFERGYMNHGGALFEGSTHVPLVIRFPGQSRGEKLSGLAQSVDIAPTILAAAGIDVPRWMDGRALLSSKASDTGTTVTLIIDDVNVQKSVLLQMAIWSSPYKFIVSCESGHALLYNLRADPKETTDLSESAPTVVTDLKRSLKTTLDKQIKGPKAQCANGYP